MKRLKHYIFYFFFGIAVASIVYAASQTVGYWPFLKIQNTIDDSHFLRRFLLQNTNRHMTDNIIIVDIDDASLFSFGLFKRWPRRRFATVIRKLNKDGARLIFLDALLMDGGSEFDNNTLTEAIGEAKNVLLGYYFSLDTDSSQRRPQDPVYNERFSANWLSPPAPEKNEFIKAQNITLPYYRFWKSANGLGFTNYIPDPDGILRHIPLYIGYGKYLHASASLRMWLYLTGKKSSEVKISPKGISFGAVNFPTDKHCFMRLNYIASKTVYPYVPFMDVHDGNFEEGTFKDKVVMIGSSSKELGDLKRIPGKNYLPGVEIHATALSTLLNGEFIYVLSGNVIFVITIVCGALASVVFSSTSLVKVGLPVAITVPILLYVYSIYAFIAHSQLINISLPSFVVVLIYIVLVIHLFFEEYEKKEAMKNNGH